jgi:hypothetical protein
MWGTSEFKERQTSLLNGTGDAVEVWRVKEKRDLSWALAPLAHTCNPGYLGGRDQEDCESKPAQANI